MGQIIITIYFIIPLLQGGIDERIKIRKGD